MDTLCGVGGAPGSAEQQAELRALLDEALRGIDTKEEEVRAGRAGGGVVDTSPNSGGAEQ